MNENLGYPIPCMVSHKREEFDLKGTVKCRANAFDSPRSRPQKRRRGTQGRRLCRQSSTFHHRGMGHLKGNGHIYGCSSLGIGSEPMKVDAGGSALRACENGCASDKFCREVKMIGRDLELTISYLYKPYPVQILS
jgi:hypothetical protein